MAGEGRDVGSEDEVGGGSAREHVSPAARQRRRDAGPRLGRLNRIRVTLGDRVRIELCPYDLRHGGIVYRLG
jgi:hypothetical protein